MLFRSAIRGNAEDLLVAEARSEAKDLGEELAYASLSAEYLILDLAQEDKSEHYKYTGRMQYQKIVRKHIATSSRPGRYTDRLLEKGSLAETLHLGSTLVTHVAEKVVMHSGSGTIIDGDGLGSLEATLHLGSILEGNEGSMTVMHSGSLEDTLHL